MEDEELFEINLEAVNCIHHHITGIAISQRLEMDFLPIVCFSYIRSFGLLKW